MDTSFRSQGHGGLRTFKFLPNERQTLSETLWHMIKENPQPTVRRYAQALNDNLPHLPNISIDDVKKLLHSWNWSWKIPTQFQIQKYSSENLIRYYNYVYWFHNTPWNKIKFLDEVHFQSSHLVARKTLGAINERVVRVSHASLDERYTATVLLTPQRFDKPLEFFIRKDSNTQWDFCEFVVNAFEHGALSAGDHLVIDNAAVHAGMDCYPLLAAFLQAAQIKLVFLPAYSPELNPAELVFGFVKNYLRKYRRSNEDLFQSLIYVFSLVPTTTVLRFYAHCSSF